LAQEAIAHFYPTSTYATALDAGIRERAARRIFSPPRTGTRVICPHCGAPNAAPGMDEVFFFYCARCGNSVKVPEPKVN
jgi:DNA-directed RNA polymerase subunit RPC12/RpoP